MLWNPKTKDGAVADVTEYEPVRLLPAEWESQGPEPSKDDPPELPPVIEQERQPPRKGSNLTYKRTQLPNGVQISAVARPGRVIDEVIRFDPSDGTDPVLKIITRRSRGRPSSQQTNGAGDV